jgi:hypothetical protein
MGKIVGDNGEFCFKEALDIGGEGSTRLDMRPIVRGAVLFQATHHP